LFYTYPKAYPKDRSAIKAHLAHFGWGTPINLLPHPTPPDPHPLILKKGPPTRGCTLFCSNDHVFLRIASLLKHFSMQKSGCVLSAVLVI